MRLFTFNPKTVPRCWDETRARVGWERFLEAVSDNQELESFATNISKSKVGMGLARAIFGNSPFLTSCWLADTVFTKDLLEHGPQPAFDAALHATRVLSKGLDDGELKQHLRIQKRRVSFCTALADITGVWDLATVTHALSDFADAAVAAAAAFHLTALAARNKIKLKHADDPEKDSGLVILGMGKLGGRELNYSSDIDLIILFDSEAIDTDEPMELGQSFVRLARGIVSTLDDRTADGYVFRTDLRLRPDPGSTPLALSTMAAEVYYESIGQNWERAAMIKARVIAGDKKSGQHFLDVLKPFVWRKSLDFDTIQDIQSIKNQINAHRGQTKIKLLGHNVKLGRGGIREIEFYTQTQQLIWGGRDRNLRTVPTCDSLRALVKAGLEKTENAKTLIKAYEFFRKIEHRLQMVDDAQTHTLPDTEDGIAHIAIFLGYDDSATFQQDLLQTLNQVEILYAQLFKDQNTLSANTADTHDGGNLVFTGGESDPDTLTTLSNMGFTNVSTIDNAVRGWHHGRYRAMRSTRAREILTQLMPKILGALANTSEPDTAFLRFDTFLSKLPSGVQLFSMFQSNPSLLDLIADIMGTAPRLADHLSKKVGILDSVLTPGFFADLPSAKDMKNDLEQYLVEATCMEDVLDMCRRWSKDHKFQVGVQILNGTICERESQRALTNIAQTLLQALQPRVEQDFAIRHGYVAGGMLGVIAYGKLGSCEKTPTSDMDLTFVYDHDENAETSDGAKPLAINQYYTRLCQRFINALSAPTAEGELYEVDMRLRPRGDSGPVATPIAAFQTYQKTEAWTWEHMALTRARVVSGPDVLKSHIQAVISTQLCTPRNADKLIVDVADMRERMDKDRHTDNIWSIKNYRGGLVDIEFITQYLQLRHASAHPEILSPTTRTALSNLEKSKLLDTPTANRLIEALDLWQSLQGLLRLTISIEPNVDGTVSLPKNLVAHIARITDTPNIEKATHKMKTTATWVLNTFTRLIIEPAEKIRPTIKSDLQTNQSAKNKDIP